MEGEKFLQADVECEECQNVDTSTYFSDQNVYDVPWECPKCKTKYLIDVFISAYVFNLCKVEEKENETTQKTNILDDNSRD